METEYAENLPRSRKFFKGKKKLFKDDLLEEEEKGSLRQIERVNV